MVPSTPTSLVNPAVRLSSVSTGAVSSTPASDHVPHETYPKRSSAAGTANTAEAVSCEPTAVTGTEAGSPVSAATSARSVPTEEPGRRSGGDKPPGPRRPGGRGDSPMPARASDMAGGGRVV